MTNSFNTVINSTLAGIQHLNDLAGIQHNNDLDNVQFTSDIVFKIDVKLFGFKFPILCHSNSSLSDNIVSLVDVIDCYQYTPVFQDVDYDWDVLIKDIPNLCPDSVINLSPNYNAKFGKLPVQIDSMILRLPYNINKYRAVNKKIIKKILAIYCCGEYDIYFRSLIDYDIIRFNSSERIYLDNLIIEVRGEPISMFRDYELETSLGPEYYYLAELECFNLLRLQSNLDIDSDVVDYIESFAFSLFSLSRCKTIPECVLQIIIAIKLLTKKSVCSNIIQLVNTLMSSIPNREQSKELEEAENILENYAAFKNSRFFKDIYGVFCIVIAKYVLDTEVDNKLMEGIRQEGLKILDTSIDYPIMMARSILFIFRRCQQCIIDRDWHSLIFDDATIQTWTRDVEKLDRLFPFYSNLRPHGMSIAEFDVLLEKCISYGEQLLKRTNERFVQTIIKRQLNNLNRMNDLNVAHRSAAASRTTPYAVELFGPPGIGKTMLCELMFNYFASHRKLPSDNKYLYTRNSKSDYWDLFRSYKWCVLFDDVGQDKPDRVQGVETCVSEIINVVNSCNFTAVMPDVDSKGKYPVTPELVFVTTNVLDLNTKVYASAPYAVMRRFRIILDIKVKSAFADEEGKLDPDKIEKHVHETGDIVPNYWIFTVKRATTGKIAKSNISVLNFKTIATFGNIHEMMAFFLKDVDVFYNISSTVEDRLKEVYKMPICDKCYRIKSFCICTVPQSGSVPSVDDTLPCSKYVPTWVWFIVWMFSLFGTAAFSVFYQLPPKYMWGLSVSIGLMGNLFTPFFFILYPCVIIGLLDMKFGLLNRLEAYLRQKMTPLIFKSVKDYYVKRINKITSCNIATKILYVFMFGAITIAPITAAIKVFIFVHGKLFGKKEQSKKSDVNVWHKDTFRLTPRDLGPSSHNYAKLSDQQLCEKLGNNVARILLTGSKTTITTLAISPGGHHWVLNKHALLHCGDPHDIIRMTILYGDGEVVHRITEDRMYDDFFQYEARDIIGISTRSVPPRPKIINLLLPTENCKSAIFRGIYIQRDDAGKLCYKTVGKIRYEHDVPGNEAVVKQDYWRGVCEYPTKFGDCGSMLVSTGNSTAILGIHTLGAYFYSEVYAAPLWSSDFSDLNSTLYELGPPKAHSDLSELHSKSTIRYIEDIDHLDVFGTENVDNPNTKSAVALSPMADHLRENGVSTDLEAPDYTGDNRWKPEHRFLSILGKLDTQIPSSIMDWATADYLTPFLHLGTKKYNKIRILSMYEAVNGIPGERYIDGMIRNTSVGYPRQGIKREYMKPVPREDYPDGMMPIDEIMDEVEDIWNSYCAGRTAGVIFKTARKDEPISHDKNLIGKIRIFNTCPMSFTIVSRRIFLSLIAFLQENRDISEMAVGINCHSPEWLDLLRSLVEPTVGNNLEQKILNSKIIAGDFKSFDLSMHVTTLHAARKVILVLLSLAGWPDEDIRIADLCLHELIYKHVKVKGDIYRIMHSNPSGNSLTVIINCIVNSLYMRCVYVYLSTEKYGAPRHAFRDKISLVTYGDDNIACVSPDVEYFNHKSIRDVLGQFNIGYTMAEKEAEFVEYIALNEATFLKRKWVYLEDHKTYVAPLSIKSIDKMLCIWTYSKIPIEEQLSGVLRSMESELHFHGKEVYDKYLATITQFLDKREFTFKNPITGRDEELGLWHVYRPRPYVDVLEEWLDKELAQSTKESISEGDTTTRNISTPATFAGTEHEQGNSTLSTGPALFSDKTTGSIIDIPDSLDDISSIDHIGQTDIDKFFARPVRIKVDDWASYYGVTIQPWDLFCNDNIIKNKLLNYAYMRANLHIKIVVNSSPFNYGAIQAAYYPYCLDQSELNYGIDTFIRSTFVPAALHVYLQSPLPHIVAEASSNKGGEMVVPFIYDRNYVHLANRSALQRLGKLSFRSLADLRQANGGTPAATITVYAWLEDVKLTGLTKKAVVQSDEYGKGPISKPASTVAYVATSLSKLPYIGPFATATATAAGAVSKIASMFGYTNVPVIDNIPHRRMTGIGNMASSEIGSQIEKLSLDPKNEVTIDPRTLGADDDDMIISRIASREGLIAVSELITTDNIDTQIFTAQVTPNYVLSQIASIGLGFYVAPIAHAAMPFGYWRGDIIYRFKLVATPFHKCRLRISWDTIDQPLRTATGYQTALTAIWDLAETDEMEFCVPYQAETAFLKVKHTMTSDTLSVVDNTALADNEYTNGVISVVVVNELTAPVDTSTINMLVYVRAADNFEVAMPVNILPSVDDAYKFSFLEPQSREVKSVSFKHDDETDPNIYKVHFGEVVKSIKVLMYRSNLYTSGGFPNAKKDWREQISFPRLPLFFGYDNNGVNSARNQGSTANAAFNWVRTTPYHWFAPAYVFQRGGHNYRIVIWKNTGTASVTRVVYTSQDGVTDNNYRAPTSVAFDTNGRGMIVSGYHNESAGTGCSVAIPEVNSTLEFCMPFYSNYRAIPNMPKSVNLPPFAYWNNSNGNSAFTVNEPGSRDGHNLEGYVLTSYTKDQDDTIRYEIYHSVGVDFSFAFYRGCPCLYQYAAVPGAPI